MDFKLKDFVEEDSRAYFVGVRYLEHRQNTLTPAGGLPENGAPTGVCEGPNLENASLEHHDCSKLITDPSNRSPYKP